MDRATRFIIWNQLEILKALKPDEADDIEIQQDVIASGYTTRYEDLMPSISLEEASQEMQEEVLEILDMFRALSIARNNGWKPSRVDASKFQGFDGNNDPHYFFADHLLNSRGLFAESAPNKNSHSMGTISKYRRMLAVWKASHEKFELTDVEAEAVISA
ncbi:uncharacterized protein YfbU (UPF0304 family) [Agrobacterium pusense]|uniref:YfbU family protein n=1 Tax=Agrobacterium pusense TaxID=648995 RepID=UPI000DD3734C|nr:YfbU family protein [Agrobacterium pusense]MDR6190362.1 uncharacterized protein YfbU (UPF0304 family) [Agrobacterium pusense]